MEGKRGNVRLDGKRDDVHSWEGKSEDIGWEKMRKNVCREGKREDDKMHVVVR